MTELKTLKDLSFFAHKTADVQSLRAEAIKWVKMIHDIRNKQELSSQVAYYAGQEDVIKHFFNINEEDLR